MILTYTNILLCWAFGALIRLSQSASCRPFNSVYPAPRNTSNNLITSTSQGLNAAFTELLQNQTIARVTNSTSFSLQVYSLHDSQPLLTLHHTAPSLATSNEGVTKVDSDTVYRLGSISKVLTVYIYLLTAGDSSFNDPITKYVPELAEYAATRNESDVLGTVDWDSITVGALASQLSGIFRDPNPGPQIDSTIQMILGLSPSQVTVPSSDFCGDPLAALKFPCNRTAFFDTNLFRPPVMPPSSTPVYSNLAYQIFSYALENITDKSFPDLFQKYLVDAHNLQSTTYSIPANASNSIVPVNATVSLYNLDLLDGSVYGGYFSSINDLTILGRAILNSTFLSPTQTRRWLKPLSFLPPSVLTDNAGVYQAVGAPWEIIRAPAPAAPISKEPVGPNATAAETYQTWVYTKDGDLGAYSSLMGLLPEFDIGFEVLAAGTAPHAVVTEVGDFVTEAFVPALFESARQQTAQTYAGTYTDKATNSSAVLQIAGPMDAQQGLALQSLVYNGTDLIAAFGKYIYGLPEGYSLELMLYPSGLRGQVTQDGSVEEGWRAITRVPGDTQTRGAFSSECFEWASIGGTGYGGISFDDFVFTVKEGSQRVAVGLEVPAFQINLAKVK